jgi:hypothetical protein
MPVECAFDAETLAKPVLLSPVQQSFNGVAATVDARLWRQQTPYLTSQNRSCADG